MPGCSYFSDHVEYPDTGTKRLLVHARRCRQMASATRNEEIAAELRKLAVECTCAAGEAAP